MKSKDNFNSLISASKISWNNHNKKQEQIKFLKKFHSMQKQGNSTQYLRKYLWKNFFPMISWNLFSELYDMRKIKSKKLNKLSSNLLSGKSRQIRGSCIFTAIAAAIASIATAASSAGAAVAGGVGIAASAVASSSLASAAATGIISGAAGVVGAKIVDAI